ncbi:ankyrin repeat domain-containing protein [Candidatus Micrarchaeota archaeon]|nr:ankyrin repeat domain-containing protein [Candidatus Micrarchaeota archaeon]
MNHLESAHARRLDEPIPELVRRRDHLLLKTRLATGAKASETGAKKQTGLHVAAETGDTIAADHLLKHGGDANQRDENDDTPLLIAVQQGHVPLVERFRDHKGNPTLANKQGLNAYDLAKKHPLPKRLKLLAALSPRDPRPSRLVLAMTRPAIAALVSLDKKISALRRRIKNR